MTKAIQTRIDPNLYCYFAIVLLLVGQIAMGTDPIFALGVALFGLLTIFALNTAGGIGTLPGLCITLFAGQQVLVSQVAKAILGQPADTGLFQPLATIEVYDLSICGVWLGMLAVKAAYRSGKPPLCKPLTDPAILLRLAVVTTALSVLQVTTSHVFGADQTSGVQNTGGIIGPLKTLTFLPYLAVAACTAYAIVSTSGRKCVFSLSYFAIGVPCLFGLFASGRAEIGTPFVVWIVTCLAFHYRIKQAYWMVLLAVFAFGQLILGPYALYARGIARSPNPERNFELDYEAFLDVLQNPTYYQNQSYVPKVSISAATKHYWYYGHPNPSLDRLSIICTADGIVDATINYGTIGWETIMPGIDMLLPRFMNPNKLTTVGNFLAHRTPGLVSDDDYTTGITLGFSCDAFSSFGWYGVPIIAFLLTFCLFGGLAYIIDLRLACNVWALGLITVIPWNYSESDIAASIINCTSGILTLAFSLWAIQYVATSRFLNILPGLRAARDGGQAARMPYPVHL